MKMRHFDVQLIGGITLHQGKIAEMRTGEGKTLVATLPAYLNALPGEGVHVVTVNEYLAQRDSDWMAPVYRFLGLTVGVIKNAQSSEEKRAAYACDITYGTNNEFGFDYLRDNLAFRLEDRVQRSLSYAIIDEVDSILIDEARTPLIISGPAEESTELYLRINQLVPHAHAPADRGGSRRLLGRREGQAGAHHRGGPRARRAADGRARAAARGREPLRRGQHPPDASPERGAARARALPPRRRVHRARRRGDHRRRVHRPHDARPALVRRPAPGGRGQGGRARARGEPDGRLDHLPELLPPLQEALRHDRYRRHRGAGVPADLRPGGGGDPDAPPDDPQGHAGLRLSDAEGQVRGHHRGHQGLRRARASRCWSARPRSRPPSSSRVC